MKKIYKINLFKSPGRVLRKSLLNPISFYLKIISFVLDKIKPKKKKVSIDNNNRLPGSGRALWKYIGDIKNFIPHGKGVISSKQYNFKGTFINGKANGFGEENNTDLFGLGKYSGEFVNNLKQGKGTFYFYDGSKYTGNWKNNLKHGNGTYIFKDGFKLEGKWFKDLYTDFGSGYASIERVYQTKSPTIKYKDNFFKYVDYNSKKEK